MYSRQHCANDKTKIEQSSSLFKADTIDTLYIFFVIVFISQKGGHFYLFINYNKNDTQIIVILILIYVEYIKVHFVVRVTK